jgi:hypothetical protein
MEVYQPIASPRLFPALSAPDRMHLEMHGFVLLENTLSTDEVETLKSAAYRLEAEVRAGATPARPAYVHSASRLWFRVDNIAHLDECFMDYITHPLLWGAAEEAVGGEARLEQSDMSIFRPGPDGEQEGFGLHRGPLTGGGWIEGGLYHYPFVKTLTMLTDVGPDDGGTVVVPGSHRLDSQTVRHAMAAAEADPRLRKQVTASAGSTLLFFESTLHGSGRILSDRDRVFIVAGYTPPMFQPWHEYDVDPEWAATRSRSEEVFLTGANRWLWQPRPRDMSVAEPETLDAARERSVREAEAAAQKAAAARAAQEKLGKVR